jgi:O-antigen/teichoic acid export membrane protein
MPRHFEGHGEAPLPRSGHPYRDGSRAPILSSFGASGAIQLANIATGVLLARWLGPHHRGELAAVILWPSILAAVGSLGLTDATTFYAARGARPVGVIVGTALVLGAVQSMALIGIGFAVLPLVVGHYGSHVVHVAEFFLAFIPLNIATLVLAGGLSGAQRFGSFQLVRIATVASNAIGLGALALTGKLTVESGATVYLLANFATALIAMGLYLRLEDHRLSFERKVFPSLVSFGIRSHLGNVSSLLNQRLDQLLISVFLAPVQLGVYVVAGTLSSATMLVGTSVSLIAFPRIARSESARASLAKRFIAMTVIGSVILSVPIFLFTKGLLTLFFGHSFASATTPSRVLLVAAVVLSTNRVLGATLAGLGRPLEQGIGELLALVATAASLAALLPRFGLLGAAVASLIAYAMSMAWMLYRLRVRVGDEASRMPEPRALRPRARWHMVAALVPAIVAATFGAALSFTNPSWEIAVVSAIALVCAGPLVLRGIRGTWDIFEPIVLANVTLLVMFAIHPAALLATRTVSFKGYDTSSQLRGTLVVALVAVAAFQIGYASSLGRTVASRLRRPSQTWSAGNWVAYGLVLAALGAVLFSVFIAKSGGLALLRTLLQGRTGSQDAIFRASSAYLYGAPQVLIPASLLLLASGMVLRRKRLIVLAILVVLPLAIFTGARGQRSVLLPLLMTLVVYWYVARNRRPRLVALAIGSYLLLTVGLAYFRDARVVTPDRNRGAELVRALRDPSLEIRQLAVSGVDVDMFESIAVEKTVIAQGILHPSPIDLAWRLVAKPIPSVLWKGKPKDPDEYINKSAFPGETVRASNSTGPIGTLYYGGEFAGVAIGMMLLGLLLRVPWEYWRLYPTHPLAHMMLTIAIGFAPVVFRAGIGDMIARSLFVVVPILVAPRFLQGRSGYAAKRLVWKPG